MAPVRLVTITTDSKTKSEAPQSLVWDFPLRAFHWLLALSLCASWATAEAGFEWIDTHNLLGYCALTLVLFRILWGFAGTRYARFGNFLTGPGRVASALPLLFSRTAADHIGHNPIGGWSVLLFIGLVAIQAGTGLFITDDVMHAGPYNHVISSSLAGQLAQVHHLNFTALQIFVVIHIAAIAWYHYGKHTALVPPMIHGRKPLADPRAGIVSSELVKAGVLLAVAAATVTAVVQLAPAPSLDDFLF